MFRKVREVSLATVLIMALAVIGLNAAAAGIYSLTLNQGKVFSLDWSGAAVKVKALGTDYPVIWRRDINNWLHQLTGWSERGQAGLSDIGAGLADQLEESEAEVWRLAEKRGFSRDEAAYLWEQEKLFWQGLGETAESEYREKLPVFKERWAEVKARTVVLAKQTISRLRE